MCYNQGAGPVNTIQVKPATMSGRTLQTTLEQAKRLHQQGRLAEAAPLYRQVLAATPEDTMAGYLLALLLNQQNNPAQALDCLNEVLRRDPTFAEALILRATIGYRINPRQALEDFGAVTSRQPGNCDAWYNQGVLLAELGRNREAISAFERALQVRPHAAAWNNRGTALLAEGRAEEAETSFSQALTLQPDYTASLYNRATARLQLQHHADAVNDFDSYLKHAPDSFQAWNNRGIALQAVGRLDEALASYNHATRIRPDYAPAWKNSALVLTDLKRFAEAVSAFDRTRTLSPADPQILRGQASALSQQKRFNEAARSLAQAVTLEPNDAGLWAQYASVLRFDQQFDAALAAAEKAAILSPSNPEVLAMRGGLLCEMNRIREGMECYARHGALTYSDRPQHDAGEPAHKIRHDLEQRAWLAGQAVVVPAGTYHLMDGDRLAGRAVNGFNSDAVTQQWLSNHPQIVVIDDLLSVEALTALRRFCWGSTVWKQPYPGGYLGAMQEHGFSCPLLAQIAEELRDTFPSIFRGHGLVRLWGFKYDSALSGIRLHADQAVVNVNFWITPDEANLDPAHGGLVLWDKSAPLDWDFQRYNSDEPAAREFLKQAGANSVIVPHHANRAVIFDSDLFHETDAINFKDGYLNRRINITLLYGRRTFDGS